MEALQSRKRSVCVYYGGQQDSVNNEDRHSLCSQQLFQINWWYKLNMWSVSIVVEPCKNTLYLYSSATNSVLSSFSQFVWWDHTEVLRQCSCSYVHHHLAPICVHVSLYSDWILSSCFPFPKSTPLIVFQSFPTSLLNRFRPRCSRGRTAAGANTQESPPLSTLSPPLVVSVSPDSHPKFTVMIFTER